jgi:myo-inositol-1(or 4)-monophosphatase
VTATGKDEGFAIQARLDFASGLAREVGRTALRFFQENGSQNLGTTSKGLQDFVTLADRKAEDTIRKALAEKFPADGFIGEETGGQAAKAGYWVVDPIDGTANYMRGLRHWGVSIAYVGDGETLLGVIHDSPTDRLYSARAGHGARRDGEAIHAATTSDAHEAMGILGVSRRTEFEIYLAQLRALNDAGIEHRRIGSAAIGIVRVAEGVADFYYEKHLNCWDAMAALLIAKEAGAQVFAPPTDLFVQKGGEVLCAGPKLANQIAEVFLPDMA